MNLWIARLIRYVVTFFFYGSMGYLLENALFGKTCTENRSVVFARLGVPRDICVPFYPIWGGGAVILAILNDFLTLPAIAGSQALGFIVSMLLKTTVATVSLTVLECVAGRDTLRGKHGARGWDYSDHTASFCNGFCSPKVSVCWAGASALFFVCDPVLRVTQALGIPT